MTDSLNTKNTSAEHGVCTCTGVGLRTILARLTGRVEHAAECKTTGGRDVRNLKDGGA